nr:protein phosphatase 2C domain-containing protein [Streptomyces sp. ISL-86]
MSMHRLSGCPSCAEPLEEGDRFCGVCGYAVSAPPPSASGDRPTIPVAPLPPSRTTAGEALAAQRPAPSPTRGATAPTGRSAGGSAAAGGGADGRAGDRAGGSTFDGGGADAAGRADGSTSFGGGGARTGADADAGSRAGSSTIGGGGTRSGADGDAGSRAGSSTIGGGGARSGADADAGSRASGGAAVGGGYAAPAAGGYGSSRAASGGYGATGASAPGWGSVSGAAPTLVGDQAGWAAGPGEAPYGTTPAQEPTYSTGPQGAGDGRAARYDLPGGTNTPPEGTPWGTGETPHDATPPEPEPPYGATSRGTGHEAPYSAAPQGTEPGTPSGADPQGSGPGTPSGADPQSTGHGTPYGASPQGTPHDAPYSTGPQGAADPQGSRRDGTYGATPQGSGQDAPYGAAPQGNGAEGSFPVAPQGDGGKTCVACRAGRVDTDGYCEHCGHAQPRERDHLEEELGSVAAVSDRGLRHHRNEDSFAVAATALPDGSAATVAIVCDGVSSASRPDEASAAAAGAANEALLDALPRGAHPQEAMHEAILAAATAVNALAPETPGAQNAPACTLVGAVVSGGLLTIGWVGDSRAYWVPDDRAALARRLTEDDSWAAQMVAAGLMGEAEAYADVRAHAITGWLGADAYELEPHTATFKPDHAGVVVVCTDGLWNYAESAQEMAQVLPADAAARPLHSAQVLVGHALDGGGHDNVTVAVVPFAAPPSPEAEPQAEAAADAEAEAEPRAQA